MHALQSEFQINATQSEAEKVQNNIYILSVLQKHHFVKTLAEDNPSKSK
jgi:hypothetical protein